MGGTRSLPASGGKGRKVVPVSALSTVSATRAAQDAVGDSRVTSWRDRPRN